METVRIALDKRLPICMCALKPRGPCIDDLVELLVSISNCFEFSGCVQSFILRSIHGNLVVWGGVWTTECDMHNALRLRNDTMEKERESMLSSMADVMGPIWYHTYCGESQSGLPCVKISKGDIVTIRIGVTELEKQDSMCYACTAILKAYFNKTKGLTSFTCFRSLDGNKVVGLGVWKELLDAYAWILDSTPHSEKSMEAFVAELVVNSRYDIMEVVYSTNAADQQPPNTIFPPPLP